MQLIGHWPLWHSAKPVRDPVAALIFPAIEPAIPDALDDALDHQVSSTSTSTITSTNVSRGAAALRCAVPGPQGAGLGFRFCVAQPPGLGAKPTDCHRWVSHRSGNNRRHAAPSPAAKRRGLGYSAWCARTTRMASGRLTAPS